MKVKTASDGVKRTALYGVVFVATLIVSLFYFRSEIQANETHEGSTRIVNGYKYNFPHKNIWLDLGDSFNFNFYVCDGKSYFNSIDSLYADCYKMIGTIQGIDKKSVIAGAEKIRRAKGLALTFSTKPLRLFGTTDYYEYGPRSVTDYIDEYNMTVIRCLSQDRSNPHDVCLSDFDLNDDTANIRLFMRPRSIRSLVSIRDSLIDLIGAKGVR